MFQVAAGSLDFERFLGKPNTFGHGPALACSPSGPARKATRYRRARSYPRAARTVTSPSCSPAEPRTRRRGGSPRPSRRRLGKNPGRGEPRSLGRKLVLAYGIPLVSDRVGGTGPRQKPLTHRDRQDERDRREDGRDTEPASTQKVAHHPQAYPQRGRRDRVRKSGRLQSGDHARESGDNAQRGDRSSDQRRRQPCPLASSSLASCSLHCIPPHKILTFHRTKRVSSSERPDSIRPPPRNGEGGTYTPFVCSSRT